MWFINSVVWMNDAINRAPVWCDISARIIIGLNVAIPAASLCINRRLYHISSANTVTITKAEKRRAIMVDLAIGLGIPILEMILQYIPQGHRFDIFEEIGCFPYTYNTPVAFALVGIWPVIIGLVSAVYCVLSIKAFYKRRAQFKELLSSNNNLSSNRYFRLMALAGIEVIGTVPMGIWAIVVNAQLGVEPWLGWADTHYDFSRVGQIPALQWRQVPDLVRGLELARWSVVGCAIIFFAFFGFADEARKNYRLMINSVAKRMGYSTFGTSTAGHSTLDGSVSWLKRKGSKSGGTTGSRGGLPIFVTKETNRKRDSLDSFTSASLKDSSFNEKALGASFGALSIKSVDFHLSPPSASSDDGDSMKPPSYPSSPATDNDDDDIEISSVRRLSTASAIVVPTPPAPVLNLSNAPRHVVDIPSPAKQDPAEVV